jgi:hypothetical protein
MSQQRKTFTSIGILPSLTAVLLALPAGSVLAQEWTMEEGQMVEQPEPYSPFVLRFARGEEVGTSTGQRAQLNRPLDFLVLSDHAEYLGIADLLNTANPELLATEVGREWLKGMQAGGETAWNTAVGLVNDFSNGTPRFRNKNVERSVWEGVIDTATRYNEPGTFTALNGYEWTTSTGGSNLHRVVVFKDGPDRVKQVLPFSAFDSIDPEDLWAFMAGYEEKTGGRVLAIPHNPNLSNGVMFAETVNGKRMTRDYAERRARWEPLLEVTQMKGDSETHPILSPNDEFADFENWDKSDIFGIPKEDWMLQYEYARGALNVGLQLEDKLGANPYKFGLIGSSDTHTSLSTTREDNYFGKLPHLEPVADRYEEVVLRNPNNNEPLVYSWQMSASGLIAAWARENTREALFDAMSRKEVYATTGSRIRVRLFGGWGFEPEEVERFDFAAQGYARGVPMGGDLTNAPAGKGPSFMIRAIRDPDNANLDRVQVIKGWFDGKESHERIYDVACSDDRAIVNRRCDREVGSTVNVADASYTNTIGDPLLTAHWVDPDFDPDQRAFYYVRVIEIPKPRWTAYDAKFFGVDMPDEVPMTVQDRAYTSPIWYTP